MVWKHWPRRMRILPFNFGREIPRCTRDSFWGLRLMPWNGPSPSCPRILIREIIFNHQCLLKWKIVRQSCFSPPVLRARSIGSFIRLDLLLVDEADIVFEFSETFVWELTVLDQNLKARKRWAPKDFLFDINIIPNDVLLNKSQGEDVRRCFHPTHDTCRYFNKSQNVLLVGCSNAPAALYMILSNHYHHYCLMQDYMYHVGVMF